jgi:hypothetical protein
VKRNLTNRATLGGTASMLRKLFKEKTMETMTKTKVRIIWNGQGGELDSVIVEGDEYEGSFTAALIEMLKGHIVSPGDSFTVQEIE